VSNVRAEVFSEVEGRVVTITLNRPEVMNAFDDVMRESLLAEVERIERMRQPGRMLGAWPSDLMAVQNGHKSGRSVHTSSHNARASGLHYGHIFALSIIGEEFKISSRWRRPELGSRVGAAFRQAPIRRCSASSTHQVHLLSRPASLPRRPKLVTWGDDIALDCIRSGLMAILHSHEVTGPTYLLPFQQVAELCDRVGGQGNRA